jgi:cytochrome c oxidase assembly protein subunit 11
MDPQSANRRTVKRLLLVATAMFLFGFVVMPPFYSLLCDTFGINGRFLDIESGQYVSAEGKLKGEKLAARKDLSRTVTVQFFTSLNQNLQWEFKPLTRQVRVHPGEIKTVKFFARNKTGRRVVAQAVPSVAPGQAVKYFTKMECFCFNQQTFESDESKEMPLQFVVDPDLPKNINTITLAYTFFDTDKNAVKNNQTNKIALNEYSK